MEALWKQLKEQQAAFDLLRSTSVHPNDLDVLRVQVLDEAEAKWKQRLAAARAEAQGYLDSLREARQGYESLKARMESMSLRCRLRPRPPRRPPAALPAPRG